MANLKLNPFILALLSCTALCSLALALWYPVDTQAQLPRERALATVRTTAIDPASLVLEDKGPSVVAESALIYDIRTQTVLYAKNPEAQMPLASITKVMTALVAREVLKPTDVVRITGHALAREGESGFIEGEEWAVQNLLDFMLVTSSNDGAQALADSAGQLLREKYPHIPGDADPFIWRMNQLAKEVGLNQTYYLDATGLDVSSTQASAYGSAIDMARLFAYAESSYPNLLAATAKDDVLTASDTGTAYDGSNTNLVADKIPGLIGGKTGYTDLAGGNLAVLFDAGLSHPIAVVVLHSTKEERFPDVMRLVDFARTSLTLY